MNVGCQTINVTYTQEVLHVSSVLIEHPISAGEFQNDRDRDRVVQLSVRRGTTDGQQVVALGLEVADGGSLPLGLGWPHGGIHLGTRLVACLREAGGEVQGLPLVRTDQADVHQASGK